MISLPRWSRPTTLLLCSGFLILGACGNNAGPDTAATDATKSDAPAPGGAVRPAEATSFDEVAAHLDKGGSFYLYLSAAQWLAGLSGQISQWRDLVVPPDAAKSDPDPKKAAQFFDLGAALVKKSGLEEITGMGVSSVAIEPGVYRNAVFVHHYKGKETGFFNTLFGTAPHALTWLDLLPADTAVASFGDYDVARFVGAVRETLEQSGIPEVKDGVTDGLAKFSAAAGMSLDDALGSLGGSLGLVVTLDPTKFIAVPVGGKQQMIPAPRLAILIEVKDDKIFAKVDQSLGAIPTIVKVDEPDLRMRTMALPVSPDFQARATVARWDKYLIVASDDGLVRDLIAAHQSGQGFKGSPAFTKLAAGLPTEGNGFALMTQGFADAMKRFQDTMLDDQPGASREQTELIRKMYAGFQSTSATYAVSAHVENGWLNVGKSSQSMNKALVPLVLAPVAIAAGTALPVFNTVQQKGKATKSLAQAKQIGLACKLYAGDNDGKYPPTLDALIPTYLSDRHLFVSPFAPDEPMGYTYHPGLDDTMAPDKVLLEDKFSVKEKQQVTVHLDCSGEVTHAP